MLVYHRQRGDLAASDKSRTDGWRKPQEAHGGAPAFEDLGELRARLGAYLTQATGADVVVEKLVKFPAGFSWITYSARVAGFPKARDIIVRIGPPYGLFAPYSAMIEFDALSALEGAGVPAPRVYFASDDPDMLGAPFFLCEKVEGDTPLPWGSQGQALEGARRESARRRLHRRARRICTSSIGARRRSRVAAKASRSTTRRNCRSTTGRRASNAGRFGRIPWRIARSVGCARTRRARNGFRWSTATIGSAISSSATGGFPRFLIGSSCISATPSRIWAGRSCRNIAAARRWSAGSPARRISSRATRRARDLTVDRGALKFYLVFSLLKLAFTHMAAARCFEDGRFNDLRMPAMATQIAPVFRQIAKILELAA